MITLGLTRSQRANSRTMPDESPLSEVLSRAMEETIAWCFQTEYVAHQYRSPELNPLSDLHTETFAHANQIESWLASKREGYRQAILKLSEKRRSFLQAQSVSLETVHKSKGKILAYYPLENVADGAAEASSHGFFDCDDAPPWDTWFFYDEGLILSWVPEFLIVTAQAGIDANPVDCIRWASHWELARLKG